MDTKTVLKHLELYHDPAKWAFFVELRVGTGVGKDSESRLDAWAINFYKNKRNTTVAYELKVSRSDFFHEIKKPKKRKPGLRLANQFYFVTPKGLVSIEEVPPECGLIEVLENGTLEKTIEAPYRDEAVPTWLFVASIARRLDHGRQIEFLKTQAEVKAGKIYNTAAQLVIDRYIDKWLQYSMGSREIPDKILEEIKKIKTDINDLVRDMITK